MLDLDFNGGEIQVIMMSLHHSILHIQEKKVQVLFRARY